MRLIHPDPLPTYAPNVAVRGYTDARQDIARRTQIAWETATQVDLLRTVGDRDLRQEIRDEAAGVAGLSRFELVRLAARVQALVERADRARADARADA